MKAPLVDQLNRIEKELALLKNKPVPKPVNYKEGISLLEEANKNLDKILGDLNKKHELLEQELKLLKSKKPVKQTDYSEDIKKLNVRIDLLSGKNKSVDHSKELTKINSDIENIKKNANNKKEINLIEEIKKVVNLPYVNGLYRK
ncbi:MAG TPA: hypothetical protein EYN67_06475 [Flavobacteriales bacterium]|nr:hypothetical protein [Flavobacteriales bacterium]